MINFCLKLFSLTSSIVHVYYDYIISWIGSFILQINENLFCLAPWYSCFQTKIHGWTVAKLKGNYFVSCSSENRNKAGNVAAFNKVYLWTKYKIIISLCHSAVTNLLLKENYIWKSKISFLLTNTLALEPFGILQRRHGFELRLGHVSFVMYKVALMGEFSE